MTLSFKNIKESREILAIMNGIIDSINDIMNDRNNILSDINCKSHLCYSNYIGKVVQRQFCQK